jgi:hypothetical protein
MKKTLSTAIVLLSIFISGAVYASEIPPQCFPLKDNVARKIIRNGVPATDFKLEIVAKEEAAAHEGSIVGNCGFGSHRIMYVRGKNISPEGQKVPASPYDVQSDEQAGQPEVTASEPQAPTSSVSDGNSDDTAAAPEATGNDGANDDMTQSSAASDDDVANGEANTNAPTSSEGIGSNEAALSQPQVSVNEPSRSTGSDGSIIIHG